MGFRENLLKKIEISRLAQQVDASMGPPDSGRRIDKALARRLVAEAGYERLDKRDLELYLRPVAGHESQVLVLDNDLPLYATTPDDVTLRKSPIVKEMVKIRNIIRILNDGDVLVSKKSASIETVRQDCLAGLDLAFTEADITTIADQGRSSLENSYAEGLLEALDLFAELLDYGPAPKAFTLPHHVIMGTAAPGPPATFGPLVLYDRVHHSLKFIDRPLKIGDRADIETLKAVADGQAPADLEGANVFARLKTGVMATPSPGGPPPA
ncbi:MAG: hypothetical protein JEZ11_18290 [Desulfobacterales bacterium]|nr:hypothetical protein [Desulfobacterales bacterium]